MTTKNSRPLFANVLLAGDAMAVKTELARYKDRGMVSYRKVLEIPVSERIPALVENPEIREMILTALVASLKSALSGVNLRIGFNENQVVELADLIIDAAHEDNLGLEDVLLFLGDMLAAKMGKIYDRLDIPTFFELFETYRQRRHEEMKGFRDELDAQNKALPINDRFVYDSIGEERDKSRKAMASYFPQNQVKIKNDNDGTNKEQS